VAAFAIDVRRSLHRFALRAAILFIGVHGTAAIGVRTLLIFRVHDSSLLFFLRRALPAGSLDDSSQ
jgi:hypothetical protein